MAFFSQILSSVSFDFNSYFGNFLHFIFVIYTLQSAQGKVQVCQNVQPLEGNEPDNCSLVCSLKFHHAVSSTTTDELTLCVKNSSLAVFCISHNDCRQYYIGAYCRQVPCLCKAKSGPNEAYIFDPFSGVHKINTCVVSSKYINLDQPLVPFPWKTFLLVCAIVFLFASVLLCLRWLSPLMRSAYAKRCSRTNRDRQAALTEDNTSLFRLGNQRSDSTPFTYYFPQGLPRIYRASSRRTQRNHRSSRNCYTSCAQAEESRSRTLSNEDRPPPYEAAIQLPPPAYEDVAQAINEVGSVNYSQEPSVQRVQVNPTAGSTESVLTTVHIVS